MSAGTKMHVMSTTNRGKNCNSCLKVTHPGGGLARVLPKVLRGEIHQSVFLAFICFHTRFLKIRDMARRVAIYLVFVAPTLTFVSTLLLGLNSS